MDYFLKINEYYTTFAFVYITHHLSTLPIISFQAVISFVCMEASLGNNILIVESRNTAEKFTFFSSIQSHLCKLHYCLYASSYVEESVVSLQCWSLLMFFSYNRMLCCLPTKLVFSQVTLFWFPQFFHIILLQFSHINTDSPSDIFFVN